MFDDPSKALIPQTVSAKLVKQFPLSRPHYGTLPTVPTPLCDRRNNAVVGLTLPGAANICASQYQLYLPSKQELAAGLQRIQRKWENRKDKSDE